MSSKLRQMYVRDSGIKDRRQKAAAAANQAARATEMLTVVPRCPFPDPPKYVKPDWLAQDLFACAGLRRLRRQAARINNYTPEILKEEKEHMAVLERLFQQGHRG